MPAYPQQQQGKRHIYRNFQQHDERLHEAFELGGKNEIHQQDRDEKNHHQLVQHLAVGEETAGEGRIPVTRGICLPLHLFHQLRSIVHFIETERYIFTVASCRNRFQILGRTHLYQLPKRNILHFALTVRTGLYQCLQQHLVHCPLLAHNADRQVLLVGMEHSYAVLLECRPQRTVKLVIRNVIEQQLFLQDAYVKLVLESDTYGRCPRKLRKLLFQSAQFFRRRRLLLIAGIKFRHHIGLPGHEKLLEHGFGWRKGDCRQRIFPCQPLARLLLQGSNPVRRGSLEIQFCLRRRESLLTVQQIVLLAYGSRLFHSLVQQLSEQHIHTMPVLVHMYVFVPFHVDYQFILVYLRHTLLADGIEQKDTKRYRNHTEYATYRLVGKYPVDARIIKTVQRMFLQRIVDADAGEPRPAAQPCPVDQHIEDRQQHDTREVGNQQPYRNRECLVIEQRPCNAAHKYQRHKYGNSGQRRTQHGRNHLTRSRHASPPQRIAPFAILRNVLRHNDAAVNHHTQRQD